MNNLKMLHNQFVQKLQLLQRIYILIIIYILITPSFFYINLKYKIIIILLNISQTAQIFYKYILIYSIIYINTVNCIYIYMNIVKNIFFIFENIFILTKLCNLLIFIIYCKLFFTGDIFYNYILNL